MNRATRSSKKIQGGTFSVVCKNIETIEVFQYSAGVLRTLNPVFNAIDDGLFKSVVEADSDGYYFVRSGRNIQSLKKGAVEHKLFLFDALNREDLELHPESFNDIGEKIGDNIFSHIGSGIYEIIPLTLDKSVVKISNNLFSSFPNAELATDCVDEKTSTVIRISPKRKKAGITIGGSDIITNIQKPSVGLHVGQTIFRI